MEFNGDIIANAWEERRQFLPTSPQAHPGAEPNSLPCRESGKRSDSGLHRASACDRLAQDGLVFADPASMLDQGLALAGLQIVGSFLCLLPHSPAPRGSGLWHFWPRAGRHPCRDFGAIAAELLSKALLGVCSGDFHFDDDGARCRRHRLALANKFQHALESLLIASGILRTAGRASFFTNFRAHQDFHLQELIRSTR